jgi:teichuronic acid exporter
LSKNIKSKTYNSLFWATFDAAGMQVSHFTVMIILSRILDPGQFGLIAMISIFIVLSQSLVDGGFGNALIQKKKIKHIDECSVFYFNIGVSVIITMVLWSLAPIIASYYRTPALINLIKISSFSLIIDSFGMIHYILLKKKLSFKILTKISFFSSFFSGIIGIYLAYNSYGVLSIVYFNLLNKLFRVLFYWMNNHWKPKTIFSFNSLKSMFPFGSRLMLVGILDTFFNNIYFVIIGRLYSPTDLGFYYRGRSLQNIPVQNMVGIVNRVMFSVFSKINNDIYRLERVFRKSLICTGMLNSPLMFGIAIIAEPLVLILLTEKWISSVIYIQLLCGAGLFVPLSTINLNILKSLGDSKNFLKLELIKKIITIIAIMATYKFGIVYMIIGQIFVQISNYLLCSYYSSKLTNYSVFKQTRDLLPFLIFSSFMGLGMISLNIINFESVLFLLIFQISFGIIFYFSICYFFKIRVFMEIFYTLINRFKTFK